MKTKTFDAVEMKRRGAERIHEQTKGMTPEEELAFWRQRTEVLRKRQQTAQEKRRSLPG
jgi:hypothetical protein